MATTSTAGLVAALNQCRLLEPSQLRELDRLQARYPEPRLLGKQLLERGWLTSYQVKQLLRGHGAELMLGPYLLLEKLGEGGNGTVYKARHQAMKRVVALKVVRKELLGDAEVVGRFYREIEVLSQISHPNIVHAYDAGPIGGDLVLAMEFVDGIDLDRLVKESGRLPAAQACEYIRQAAVGLQHAHERGLIHRDIKPSNLLVSGVVSGGVVSGDKTTGSLHTTHHSPLTTHHSPLTTHQVKILDLGLARLQQPAAGSQTGNLTLLAGPTVMQGTPDYMAPEQALDFHQAETRADIYSLGCTFFYLLTGQPPFPGGTLTQKLMRHQQAGPPALEQFRSDLPPGLSGVIGKMLAKRPQDRYQTPAEVARVLEALGPSTESLPTSSKPGPARSGQGPVHRLLPAWRWLTRNRRRVIQVAAALLLVLAGVLLILPSRQLNPGESTSELRARQDSTALYSAQATFEHPKSVFAVAFSPDGQAIATGGDDRTVRVWDLDTGRERTSLRGGGRPVTSVAFSPSGRTVTLMTGQLWEPVLGQIRSVIGRNPVGNHIVSIALSPDGKLLAAGAHHHELRVTLWDIDRGEQRANLSGHADIVHCVAFSPNGQVLASGARGGLVLIHERASGRQLAALSTGAGQVGSIAFSPDGKTLATVGWGGGVEGIQLWDVGGGGEPAPFRKMREGAGRCVAFSPDGKFLASAGKNGTVLLWDPGSGNLLATLQGHTGEVFGVAFSPDSKSLASASTDATVKLWKVAR